MSRFAIFLIKAWFSFYAWLHQQRVSRHLQNLEKFLGATILVTGGNSGLGLEAVRFLLKHGASQVVVASRTVTPDHMQGCLGKQYDPERISCVTYDASGTPDLDQLFGDWHFDWAFLNAGIAPNDQRFWHVMQVNFFAPAVLARWLLERQVKGLIYTGSFTARLFTPGGLSYTLTKLLFRYYLLFLSIFGYPVCYASVGVCRTKIWDDLKTGTLKMQKFLVFTGTHPGTAMENMAIAMLQGRRLCVATLDGWLGEYPWVILARPFYRWLSNLGAPHPGPDSWPQKILYKLADWAIEKFPERQL